jgi:hypothetical protein
MNLVAERRQIATDGQRSGTGADERDLFAVLLERHLRHQVFYFFFVVGGDAFEATDGDGFLVDASAAAGRFARSIARAAEDAGEHIRIPVDHVRLGISALGDQSNVFRNRSMRRARVLTVHHAVEILRVLNVCRFHVVRVPNV